MSSYYRMLQNFDNLNLLTQSEGNISTYPTKGNVSDALTSIVGFDNSVFFDTNTVARYAYKLFTPNIGDTYNISCFVQMDDFGVPIVGSSGSIGDFAFIVNNVAVNGGITVTNIGGNVYRCSSFRIATTSSSNCGVIKTTSQSSRKFKISGIQLTLGSNLKPYQKTT